MDELKSDPNEIKTTNPVKIAWNKFSSQTARVKLSLLTLLVALVTIPSLTTFTTNTSRPETLAGHAQALPTPTSAQICTPVPMVACSQEVGGPNCFPNITLHPNYCYVPIAQHPILSISPRAVNATIPQGKWAQVFNFTSRETTNYDLWGFPTSYGPGIIWNVPNGIIPQGAVRTAVIRVAPNVPVGTYKGMGILVGTDISAQTAFPVTIKVVRATNPTPTPTCLGSCPTPVPSHTPATPTPYCLGGGCPTPHQVTPTPAPVKPTPTPVK